MSDELQAALLEHQAAFGVELTEETLAAFDAYHEILLSRNELLHLVAPCSAEEFAVRHLLESLFVANLIPEGSKVTDVGSGGGLPGIPLAIFRKDLCLNLIESKAKKAEFLQKAAEECGIADRIRVINSQFSEAAAPKEGIVTARALDRFPRVFPKLVKWAEGRRLILFGGPSLEEALSANGIRYERTLIPMSEQRFVFEIGNH